MKKLLLVALLFAIGCGIAGLIILKRPVPEYEASSTATVAPATAPAPHPNDARPSLPAEESPPAVAVPSAPMTAANTLSVTSEQSKSAPTAKGPTPPAAQGAKPSKEPLRDPLARDALALVGLDSLAEQYWCAAINDPGLSAHERQDLIEDLNEDGLSDPKNPGPDDLPVIMGRLQIIEQNAPYAMDQVNADAFQEAYKDLVNLANRVMGVGDQVR